MKNHYFLGGLLLAGGLAFSASAQDIIHLNVADYYGENTLGIEAVGTDKDGNLNPIESLTFEGVEFTFDKADGPTAPAFYIKPDGASDLRVYAANTMTIKAPAGQKIYSIQFEMTQGWYQYGEVQASTGTMICNGGETDVKFEDKEDALPYIWTASDIMGVEEVTISMTNNTVNEKDQPNRTFDGTKAVQFRFTAADITIAPMYLSLETTFIEDAFDPTPSFTGETINLEANPEGMAVLSMATFIKLEKNLDCEAPITIYHNSEPMSYIYVKNDPMEDPTQIPGCSIAGLSWGREDNSNLMQPTLITIILGEDPITGPGYYEVVVPTGFFTCGGVPVESSMLIYEISGDPGSLIVDEPLSAYVIESMPPVNGIFNMDPDGDYYTGLAMLSMGVYSNELPMVLNTECEEEAVLTDADGNVLARVNAAYDPYTAEEFQPFCMVNPFGMAGEGELNTVVFQLFEDSEESPTEGTYFLTVPAGFFLVTDDEGQQYTFDTSTLAYRIVEGDVAGAFNDFVYDASPLPNETVDLTDSFWSEGLDGFQYYLNAFEGFTLNEDCTDPVVITRDGEVIYEILPTSNTYPGVPSVTPGWVWSDEVENVITGKTEKVIKPWLVAFWLFNTDTYMGETTVGTYTLTIPDNYFKIGDFSVTGATYECKVVDSQSIVDAFKADSTVTVYNLKGMRLLDNAPASALRNLEKGCYIINGKKVIMK
ncbi:MAG: hypothetical protein K2F87_00035 [Muribaculaceae bacterium]|nr:hypothetical protein [Muribaculaceae bacterium]